MKTAIPLLLAVVFSNSSLANDKQPDLNMRLQQHVQTSSQVVIDDRMAQRLSGPQAKAFQLVTPSTGSRSTVRGAGDASATLCGLTEALLNLSKETN